MIANRMSYDPNKHHRRSIRLPGYDYAQPGAYFVTVCVQGRGCLFGDIAGDEMVPNEAGRMVSAWWYELPRKFPSCDPDVLVVMPNHIHGVIVIREGPVGADQRVRPGSCAHDHTGAHTGAPLPRIVQWFKTMTTNAYARGVNERGWTPFVARLWQRNYYEHIVRDEDELNRIREYIVNNPRSWNEDPDNPTLL